MTLYYLRLLSGTVLLFVLSFFLFLAGRYDFKYRKIPDRYTVCICLTGILLRWTCGCISDCFLNMAAGFVSISIFLFLLSFIRQGCFGGGDIKLFMASSLFLGMDVWTCFAITIFASLPEALYRSYKKNLKSDFPIGPYIVLGIFCCAIRFCIGLT